MMRVVVTGREGQVARALVDRAAASGATVIPLGRPTLDLEALDTIEAALRAASPDIIVNAAAYTAVDKAESEPERAMATNAAGAARVAEVCAALGIPIVHLSTDYVFDGQAPRPYRETDATGPTSVYGRSKLAGEQAVAAANQRHVILRTAWVFSPWGHNFLKTMLRVGATRPELTVVDDQIGCPTYAPHLAEACLAVCRTVVEPGADAPIWGVYHAAGTGETSWCGFAREIFAVAAETGAAPVEVRPITTAEYPTPARRPANSRLDCSKLQQVFGRTLPDWRLGVRDCIARIRSDT